MYLEDGKLIPETLETLVEKKNWLAERVKQYEAQIIEHVHAEYLKGHSVRGIAKRAGVAHITVLRWLNRVAANERNVADRHEP